MIKKLRMRIILSAIAAFGLVIIFVSFLVNVINYRIVTNQADETLWEISNFEGQKAKDVKPPIPPFMGGKNPEAEYVTRFFIVQYDGRGNIQQIITDKIADSSREEAEQLAKNVIVRKAERGYIGEYRYLKKSHLEGNTIVFLNVYQDQLHLKILRIITAMVAGGSLMIVSILIILFSQTAIRPIVRNIEQQKQFITDASHELKTPLTSIVTSLDVIELEKGESEWTENIRSQSNRMSKLVGELVTLSRLDEAKPIYTKEEFSLSDTAWEMLEIYQRGAKAKGKEIAAEIGDDILMQGDRSTVGQLISVLLDNAIKYAKGEGEIIFKVYEKHNKINIEISNPTSYPEPIDVKRLFDRFYRPDSSRNAENGGSGIGLAIAKAVVDAHGGKITAECPDGQKMLIRVKI